MSGLGRCRCGGKKRAVHFIGVRYVPAMYGRKEPVAVRLIQILPRCTRCGASK